LEVARLAVFAMPKVEEMPKQLLAGKITEIDFGQVFLESYLKFFPLSRLLTTS